MGCNESKAAILKITVCKAKPDDSSDDNANLRRSSVGVIRDISSATSLQDGTKAAHNLLNNNNNNNNSSTSLPNKEATDSAASSGRGSKPQTPEEAKVYWREEVPGETLNTGGISSISGGMLGGAGGTPTMDHIPSSDLGESLDVRKAHWVFHGAGTGVASSSAPTSKADHATPFPPSASHSAASADSADSGISDLDDEYAFVITENSSAELVRRVEREFTVVENLSLMVTGTACSRMLSGYQKARMEEETILENLRKEGFISTCKTKSAGGIAFQVVEATPATVSAGGAVNPRMFLPAGAQARLDERRNKFGPGDRTSEDVERKQTAAYERRQVELEARRHKMAELTRGLESEKQRVETLAAIQNSKTDAAMQKREAHLKALRDKLKAQNMRAQHVKLKKLLNAPPVPVPVPVAASAPSHSFIGNTDIFFD